MTPLCLGCGLPKFHSSLGAFENGYQCRPLAVSYLDVEIESLEQALYLIRLRVLRPKSRDGHSSLCSIRRVRARSPINEERYQSAGQHDRRVGQFPMEIDSVRPTPMGRLDPTEAYPSGRGLLHERGERGCRGCPSEQPWCVEYTKTRRRGISVM